ncbi:MAG: hypothetical protein ACD_62C00676G0005 [uncultured bacterium]|nr:MAG: hypothetical protein ACD_62C00676G0005 [uncultured bacterium]
MTSVSQHLNKTLPDAIVSSCDDVLSRHEVLCILPQRLHDVVLVLKKELFFDVLVDVFSIDWQAKKTKRFEVVYLFKNSRDQLRVCLRVSPVRSDKPSVSSLADIYSAANWAERECYDLMGIFFEGHPNLQRLLMWDEFEGHPLRKDYPLNLRQPIPKTKENLFEPFQISNNKGRSRNIEKLSSLRTQGSRTNICMDPSFRWDDKSLSISTSNIYHADSEHLIVNLGPSHPAFHGALRTQVRLDGEVIVQARSEIGYLHRCFEKHAEHASYTQIIPYSDRLNYVSALMNNVGYCKAVEDLMQITIPERAMCVRVLLCELSRVMDHLVCVGTNLVDMGALTNFWYAFNAREKITRLIEKVTGARLTYAYTRVGGLAQDLYPEFLGELKPVLKEVRQAIKDMTGLVVKNKIFLDRTQGVGAVSAKQALDWGFTGPCLRACGLPHDLRKTEPYYQYDTYDFDIPVGQYGDTYDRIMVRFEEMEQSLRIVEQCLVRMPSGPIMIDDRKLCLPAKQETYTNIEALMQHFKIIMHGIKPPPGEVYSRTEAANGELGFFLVSEGGSSPYRIKVRPPCFYLFAAFEHMIRGHMIADAVAILGSLNIVVGECDR